MPSYPHLVSLRPSKCNGACRGGKGGSLANSSLPPRKQQSSALWIKEQGVARVLSAKGSYLQTMGFTEKGHVYLQAEEMAVLQERGLILQKSESREEERSLDFPYHQLKASGLSFMYFQVGDECLLIKGHPHRPWMLLVYVPCMLTLPYARCMVCYVALGLSCIARIRPFRSGKSLGLQLIHPSLPPTFLLARGSLGG